MVAGADSLSKNNNWPPHEDKLASRAAMQGYCSVKARSRR